MNIGDKILLLRKKKRINQQMLADACKITQSTYSAKEKGRFEFTVTEIAAIANFLEVDINFFFDLNNGYENKTGPPTVLEEPQQTYNIELNGDLAEQIRFLRSTILLFENQLKEKDKQIQHWIEVCTSKKEEIETLKKELHSFTGAKLKTSKKR